MAEQGWEAVVGQGKRGCTRGESVLERQEALLTTNRDIMQGIACFGCFDEAGAPGVVSFILTFAKPPPTVVA